MSAGGPATMHAARPATMHAARLHAWGDVRVEEVPVPRIGPGELLVRIDACGVCGSDALDWYVESKAAAGPVVLGHEPVGTIVEIGAGVGGFRPGQRVFVHHHAPCEACEECRRGLWSSCETWRRAALEPGGFAEYARVAAHAVARDTLPIPDTMPDEVAVFIEPLATCVRALRRKAALERGDAVAIIGLGSTGLLMAQLASHYGAATVLGSDFLASRRALGLQLGLDHSHDPDDGPLADPLRELAPRGADVVLVCAPGEAAVRAGVEEAAPGGRVVCFAPFRPGARLTLDPAPLYFREVALLQSYSCGPDETREALRLLAEGRIDVAPLVTHRAGLEGVGEALTRAAGKAEGVKSIILPGRLSTP